MLVICSICQTPQACLRSATSITCCRCQAVTDIPSSRQDAPPFPLLYQDAQAYSLFTLAPSGPPLPIRHFKKAVICGFSHSTFRPGIGLRGCDHAGSMKGLLINRFHFPEPCINLLTDEETNPHYIPTKHNIWMALRWLVLGCRPGDSLVFHYSGHGINYALCAMNFETITDREINETFVRPLPRGVKFHAFIDVSHNGTILELPFLYRMNRSGQYDWENHESRTDVRRGTSGGEAIVFSVCHNSARSRETSFGTITSCFIQAIQGGNRNTYGSLLNSMRSAIRNIYATPRGEPQLATFEPFDVYSKPFIM